MQLADLLHLSVKMAGVRTTTCQADGCGRWLSLKQITERRLGIWMRGSWYCSVTCFRLAAEKRFSLLLSTGVEKSTHVTRMPLGLLLLSRGSISSEGLQQATSEQKDSDSDIGEALIRYGLLSEKQLTAARAAQWDCPVFSVPRGPIASQIRIPQVLLKRHFMIPLHYVAATKQLLIGFVQGIEYGPLYAIEQMTGCKTRPCFVTPQDYRIQMDKREKRCDEDPTLTELVFQDIDKPAELARVVANYCVHFKAEEAKIDICSEHLWVRLKNGSRSVDLLFRIR